MRIEEENWEKVDCDVDDGMEDDNGKSEITVSEGSRVISGIWLSVNFVFFLARSRSLFSCSLPFLTSFAFPLS